MEMHKNILCATRTGGKRINFSSTTNEVINANLVDDDGVESEASPPTPPTPPTPEHDEKEDLKCTRVILETCPLKDQIERFMHCPKCQSLVVVSFPTIYIASRCRIDCSRDVCLWFDQTPMSGTDVPLDEMRVAR